MAIRLAKGKWDTDVKDEVDSERYGPAEAAVFRGLGCAVEEEFHKVAQSSTRSLTKFTTAL